MIRALVTAAALVAGIAGASACTRESVSSTAGIAEPLRVESAQFISGALPGSAPPDGGTSAQEDGGPPIVTDIEAANTAVTEGELGLVIGGHASVNAQSVALRFADLGSGYWVVPIGGPDPSDQNLLTWQVAADFARGSPPGLHDLLFAAIGADGSSGAQADLTICIDTPVPDNLNICAPKRVPPAAVLSLDWDVASDLDIIVETPSGQIIGGKTATATIADGGSASTSSSGVLDHDSNRACLIDNLDREDIVWTDKPESGTYQVWVDLYEACHVSVTLFNVTLWLAEPQADGTQRLIEQPALAHGEIPALDATGGASRGLFVGSFALQ